MDKNELETYLLQGLTNVEIGKIVSLNSRTVGYWIYKFNLQHLMKNKHIVYNDDFFKKIDTPEKAYILGFIIADGYINDKGIELGVAISDIEILEFIQSQLGGNLRKDMSFNKLTRRFPRARLLLCSKQLLNDIKTKCGGNRKENRHIPIISENLERYLLLGFFEADGCISWGRRKDRNRIWQKVSFTSQLKMLQGIQKILLKNEISTCIKPKGTEKCYMMDFSSKRDVLKFINLVYDDSELIILKRKYNKALALRLELGEFGEPYVDNIDMVTPSEAF
jgi:intein/homing endonuclease